MLVSCRKPFSHGFGLQLVPNRILVQRRLLNFRSTVALDGGMSQTTSSCRLTSCHPPPWPLRRHGCISPVQQWLHGDQKVAFGQVAVLPTISYFQRHGHVGAFYPVILARFFMKKARLSMGHLRERAKITFSSWRGFTRFHHPGKTSEVSPPVSPGFYQVFQQVGC